MRHLVVIDCIIPVIGVHDADNEVKGITPGLSFVEPCHVLRFLHHDDVPLTRGDGFSHVSKRQNAAVVDAVVPFVPEKTDVRPEAQILVNLLAHPVLLVLLPFENEIGVDYLLLLLWQPRHK